MKACANSSVFRTIQTILVVISISVSNLAYANSCAGIRVSGELSAPSAGKSTKITLSDHGTIQADLRDKLAVGVSLEVFKGSVISAYVETANTCEVVSVNNNQIAKLKIMGATLKEVHLQGAKIKGSDGTSYDVPVVIGIMTDVNIDAALPISAQASSQDDPLGIANSVEIVTLTGVNAKKLPSYASSGKGGSAAEEITLPSDTALRYIGSSADSYTMYTTSRPHECWWNPIGRISCGDPDNVADKTFVIATQDLRKRYLEREFTNGLLVIPYKYVLSSKNMTTSSITIGPYAGYTTNWLGMSVTIPLAAGVTSVTIPTVTNGVASKTEKIGVSVAAGFLFNPGANANNVTVGLVGGYDYLGNNTDYADSGKLWLGFYVGTGF